LFFYIGVQNIRQTILNMDTKNYSGPIAQVVERSADNGEVSCSSQLRPTILRSMSFVWQAFKLLKTARS
jgi:hypothetical protein